jgi:hypothetical protein
MEYSGTFLKIKILNRPVFNMLMQKPNVSCETKCAPRMGLDVPSDGAEVILGPVANDTLYETLALYERRLLSREETIVRLRTQKLADQICLRSQAAIDLLKFTSCVEVEVAQ